MVIPAGIEQKGWMDFANLLHQELITEQPPPTMKNSFAKFSWEGKKNTRPQPKTEEEYLPLDCKPCKEEIRRIDWSEVIVVTKRDFHDHWGRILTILKEQLNEVLAISPFQPDKAFLKCPSNELAAW